MIPEREEVDSLELFPAMELEVVIYRLPSGEEVIVFEDCTGKPPIIYRWCLDIANEWLQTRTPNVELTGSCKRRLHESAGT